jgi:hypothetical protein
MAKDKLVNVVIRAKDLASKKLGTLRKGLLSLKGVIAGGIGIAGLSRLMSRLAKRAGEQEDAVALLTQQLENNNEATEENVKLLTDQAAALQKVTKFGDEQTIAAQAALLTYGLTTKQVKELTATMQDFTAGSPQIRDMETAARLLGLAFKGDTAQLKRYGLVIDQSLQGLEKFRAVVETVNKQFGGAAQAQAKTYTGQMQQLNNSFGDLEETLGRVLTQNEDFIGLVRAAKEAIEATSREFTRWREASKEAEKASKGQNDALGDLDKGLAKIGKNNVLLEMQKEAGLAFQAIDNMNRVIKEVDATVLASPRKIEKNLVERLKQQTDLMQRINAQLKEESFRKGLESILREAAEAQLKPGIDITHIEKQADAAYNAFKRRLERNARISPPIIDIKTGGSFKSEN